MAFIDVHVAQVLTKEQARDLHDAADSLHGIDQSLAQIVAKLNEPPTDVVILTPEEIATLTALNAAQAAKAAAVLAALNQTPPPPQGASA